MLLFLGLMPLVNTLSAQDFDAMLAKSKPLECSDISYNAGQQFIEYWQQNKTTELDALISYWEVKCGQREPVFRAKILNAIANKKFSESLLDEGTANMLNNFQSRWQMIKNGQYYSYDNYAAYYAYIPFNQDFDQFTQNIAQTLKEQQAVNSVEYVLADFYSGNTSDTVFQKLTKLLSSEAGYIQSIEELRRTNEREGEMNLAAYGGVWMPRGGAKFIGIKPEVGMMIGGKGKRHNVDLSFGIRFGRAAEAYAFKRRTWGHAWDTTDYYQGFYVGLDYGYDVLQFKRQELQVLGGIGVDGFSTVRSTNNNNNNNDRDHEKGVTSYNFNMGLGYRIYLNNSLYLGLKARYNIVDYRLSNVVDFTGNAFTFQLIIGGLSSPYSRDLKRMGYRRS